MQSQTTIVPSHVALLVRSVDKASRLLRDCGFAVEDPETFEGEGTREAYVERGPGLRLDDLCDLT